MRAVVALSMTLAGVATAIAKPLPKGITVVKQGR
jgi:hypothetical protein